MKIKYTALAAFVVLLAGTGLPAQAVTINILSQALDPSSSDSGFTYSSGSGPVTVGTGEFATEFPAPNTTFPQYGFLTNDTFAISGTVESQLLLPDDQIQSVVYLASYSFGPGQQAPSSFAAFANALDINGGVLSNIELFNFDLSHSVAGTGILTKDITAFLSESRQLAGFAGFNLGYGLAGPGTAGFNETTITIQVPEPSQVLGLLGFGMAVATGRIIKFKRTLSHPS